MTIYVPRIGVQIRIDISITLYSRARGQFLHNQTLQGLSCGNLANDWVVDQ